MFTQILRSLFFAAVFAAVSAPTAGAQEYEESQFSLGLGTGVSTSEYKGQETEVWPIPFISYDGGLFFVRGLTAGLRFFKNDTHEISLNLSYRPQHFDADESDDQAMRRLHDRRSTMMAGIEYALKTDWGTARVGASFDALGISGGMLVDASYAFPIRFGRLTVTPVGGLLWASGKLNDYYYGVSRGESAGSGLPSYQAGNGFSPYAGLNLRLKAADGWGVFLNGGATFLNSEITGSPMVDQDVKYSFGGGLSYTF